MLFRFAQPEFFWLLLGLPVLIWWLGQHGREAALSFPAIGLLRGLGRHLKRRPGGWLLHLRWLAFIALVTALARPQTGTEVSTQRSSGVDIILTADLSDSMWAHDFEIGGAPVDRLRVVKQVMQDFIERRQNDRLGLVAFGREAFLVSPLSLNHTWIRERLRRLQLGDIDGRGTAIGDALGTAINRLKDLEAETKIVILLTDGSHNSGELEPRLAAEVAQSLGIKVYAIGVGREGMVPFPRLNNRGEPARDRFGQILFSRGRSDIDLETLREIAEMTDGAYFHATETEELEAIYAEIDTLERREVAFNVRRNYAEQFWIPLSVALGLLALEWLLQQTRYRRLP